MRGELTAPVGQRVRTDHQNDMATSGWIAPPPCYEHAASFQLLHESLLIQSTAWRVGLRPHGAHSEFKPRIHGAFVAQRRRTAAVASIQCLGHDLALQAHLV